MKVMKQCVSIEIYIKLQDVNRFLGCSLKMLSSKMKKYRQIAN